MNLAICISTFNRVETTRTCLEDLKSAVSPLDSYRIYITDGGSGDGTVEFLAQVAEVDLAEVPGTFWNRGMFHSIARALEEAPEQILLLNDDVFLYPGSIARLSSLARANPGSILVGETVSSEDGHTISGRIKRLPKISKIAMARMEIGEIGPAITFHGNCVLIPTQIMRQLGNLDPYFTHALGDTDLGLRASALGIPIISGPGAVGSCIPNHRVPNQASRFSWRFWRRALFDPKLVPVKEWLYFCRRHSGRLWPINFLARYLRILVRSN